MNKVVIIGNLGAAPEVRSTQGGTSIANLFVATSERRKDKDGQWGEHTEWHRVTVWGKTAEACGQHLTKGSKVAVEGRLQTRKWQDKDGADRYTTEIVADNVEFLGGGQKSGGQPQRQEQPAQDPDDVEIPF